MNLTELVKYKNLLEKLDLAESRQLIEILLSQFSNNLNTYNIDFNNLKNNIDNQSKTIIKNLHGMYQDLHQFKLSLTQIISNAEIFALTEGSERIYSEGLGDTSSYKLDRDRFKNLLYDTDTYNLFIHRITEYTSWKYPGLHLGPRLGDITNCIVDLDPLYLVDDNEDMFVEIKQKWTPDYQRRLRYYIAKEQEENPIADLPASQIGFIIAVDYFNFRPLRLIKQYLSGMFSALRPGGTAMFTFNNCDYPIGVDNFNNGYYTYTPGHLVKDACTDLGFKILASFDLDNNVSWLEIQKPGTITSLKGGQNLAAIKYLGENI